MAASLYRESQCTSLLRDATSTALGPRPRQGRATTDRSFFAELLHLARRSSLGFTTAAIIKRDGSVVRAASTPASRAQIVKPEPQRFRRRAQARAALPRCSTAASTFVALRPLPVVRRHASSTLARPHRSVLRSTSRSRPSRSSALYDAFDAHRRIIQIAFAIMYVPARADHAALGDLARPDLRQPARRADPPPDPRHRPGRRPAISTSRCRPRRSEGDLAHLGETFNKMTSELRLQQNRLIAANELNDERRVFTEAVLSGVPAGVIGVDARGDDHRRQSLGRRSCSAPARRRGRPSSASRSTDVAPGARPDPRRGAGRARSACTRRRSTLTRGGRERILNVRVTSDLGQGRARAASSRSTTSPTSSRAQRTSAWADVARRIAHEIKNPLTPIQLSAERLKRRYGKRDHRGPRRLRPVHRHDHPPGRRHQAHGRRVLVLRPHAEGACSSEDDLVDCVRRSCS